MNDKTIKVGDVVPWVDVPDGALVRERMEERATIWCLRVGDLGAVVHVDGRGWRSFELGWEWDELADPTASVTIVALGLTGQESADDLRRLAEVFEVREALDAMLVCHNCGNEEPTIGELEDGTISQPWCTECDSEMGYPHFASEAERLHAAGWRPGMTAEDAARLLAAKCSGL